MANRTYTSEDLIRTVKNRGGLSGAEADGTADADILDYLNEEMFTELVPFLMRLKEEYFVLTERIDMVAGQTRYRIPKRSIGVKVRELKYRHTQGNDPTNDVDLTYYNREYVQQYQWDSSSSSPGGFFIEAVDICLVPQAASFSGSLIVPYFFRPGSLVKSDDYRRVEIINQTTGAVTVDSAVPTSWTNGLKYDVHSPESGAEIRVWSAPVTTVAGSVVTFANAIDGTTQGTKAIEVGDYLCLENEAAVPGLPKELHPMLATAAVAVALEAAGDLEGSDKAMSRLNRQIENATDMLADRNEGEVQTVAAPNSVFWGNEGYYGSLWG